MTFLGDRLESTFGILYRGTSWNSLFYADDVCLICYSKAHARLLLKICGTFEKEGYVKWNASKSVVLELSTLRNPKIPDFSEFFLNGEKLPQARTAKYLGYLVNVHLNDNDMIMRQTRRLNALKNNLSSALPLDKLEDFRLKELASAYNGIYCLPVFSEYTQHTWSKLKTAHRNFVMEVTQFKQRSPELWDPENGIYENSNTNVYGRLGLKKFDEIVEQQRQKFMFGRYQNYLNGLNIPA